MTQEITARCPSCGGLMRYRHEGSHAKDGVSYMWFKCGCGHMEFVPAARAIEAVDESEIAEAEVNAIEMHLREICTT